MILAKSIKSPLLFLLATLVLSGCKNVVVPDVQICSVAGIIAAGADCSFTGHDENSEINVKELIDLLEDGAIIISHNDRLKEQTALDQLCYDAGAQCTYEVKTLIKNMAEPVRQKK